MVSVNNSYFVYKLTLRKGVVRTACLCSLSFYLDSSTAGAWNHLNGGSLTCLVADADHSLGRQWGQWRQTARTSSLEQPRLSLWLSFFTASQAPHSHMHVIKMVKSWTAVWAWYHSNWDLWWSAWDSDPGRSCVAFSNSALKFTQHHSHNVLFIRSKSLSLTHILPWFMEWLF